MQVATLKNPKKKRKKWPIVLLLLLVFFLVAPIVVIYALFYDPNTKRVDLKNNLSFTNAGNQIITDSLDHTVDHERIEINVSENDIDNVLHLAMEKFAHDNKFVKKAYVNVKGTSYNFYIDLDGVVIKSRLKVSTTIRETEDHSAFVFQIKDVSLGRVSGINKPTQALINRFFSEDNINLFIAQTQLSVTYDADLFGFIYTKVGVMNDLHRLTQSEGLDLYFDVIQTMVLDNFVEFDFGTDDFFLSYIDLNKLKTNDLVTDDADHLKINPSEVGERCRDNIVTLINHGDIDPKTTSLNTVFNFLFSGWEALSDAEKEVIAPIDMSYVEIDDKETYVPLKPQGVENALYEEMRYTVDGDALTDKTLNPRYKKVCTLTEKNINDYIASRSIVGYNSLLYYEGEGGYKVNYVTLDNFYCNIYKDSENHNIAELVCKVNVNGFHTSLTFATQMNDDGAFEGNSLVFRVKEVKFGNTEAENLKKELFTVIAGALTGTDADTTMLVNPTDQSIAIDFTKIIAYACDKAEESVLERTGEDKDLSSYFALDNLTYVISGSSRNDMGTMELSLINPIDYD